MKIDTSNTGQALPRSRPEASIANGKSQGLPLHIVVQNVGTFRLTWANLVNPDQYRMALITSAAHHDKLLASGQLQAFNSVRVAKDFSAKALEKEVREVMDTFGAVPQATRLCSNDEQSLRAVALVREAIGIDGDRFEQVALYTDKVAMKQALQHSALRLPKHLPWNPAAFSAQPEQALNAIESALGYPIFAKPIDQAGSEGTAKLEDRAALGLWCNAHSTQQGYELDEFITGTLFHCDSIVQDSQILFTQVSRYANPCFDYFVGKPCASMTLPHDHPETVTLKDYAAKVLSALKPAPANTVTHLEVFWTPKEELVFVEVAARAPGAFVVPTYERHLGINFEETHFRLQMGLAVNAVPQKGPYAAWMFFPPMAGTVARLHQPPMRSTAEIECFVTPGQALSLPQSIREQAGTAKLWHDDFATLEHDFYELNKLGIYATDTQEDNDNA